MDSGDSTERMLGLCQGDFVMSVVLAVFVLIAFILADLLRNLYRRHSSGARRSLPLAVPGFSGKTKSMVASRDEGLTAGLLIISLLIAVIAVGSQVVAAYTPHALAAKQSAPLNDSARQQLAGGLFSAAIEQDFATLKTCQKLLTDQLLETNAALKGSPQDATLIKRRDLIAVLLTNPGGTGVKDRLDAIARARDVAASPSVYTNEDAAQASAAMASLRSTAKSWKTGTLANAAMYVGVNWDPRKGFTVATPFSWGQNGWSPDLRGAETQKTSAAQAQLSNVQK